MSPQSAKPQFESQVNYDADLLIKKIKNNLSASQKLSGEFKDECFQISITKNLRHFYSPKLELQIIATEKGSLLKGYYYPENAIRPIWKAGYVIAGAQFILSSALGFAQMSLKLPTWGLWGIPISLTIFSLLYFASLIGQALGKTQMNELHQFVDKSL